MLASQGNKGKKRIATVADVWLGDSIDVPGVTNAVSCCIYCKNYSYMAQAEIASCAMVKSTSTMWDLHIFGVVDRSLGFGNLALFAAWVLFVSSLKKDCWAFWKDSSRAVELFGITCSNSIQCYQHLFQKIAVGQLNSLCDLEWLVATVFTVINITAFLLSLLVTQASAELVAFDFSFWLPLKHETTYPGHGWTGPYSSLWSWCRGMMRGGRWGRNVKD